MNLLNLGVSGVSAARVNLETTSHNISNVNTEGYSRQSVSQSAAVPQYNGFGFLGQGAEVTAINRMFDQFVEVEWRNAQSSVGSLEAQKQVLNTIDDFLSNSSTGMVTSLQQFFNAMQTASANPTSIATRQVVLSQAQTIVDRFKTVNEQVEVLRQNIRSGVTLGVDRVNELTSQIAKVNKEIVTLSNQSVVPNDLLDQRDKMVSDLSKLLGVNVVESSNRTYNVFMENGQPLVVGMTASKLSVTQTESATKLYLDREVGGDIEISYSDLTTGSLQGNLQLLQQDIPRIQIDLGNMAVEFSDAMNRQHALGVNLSGAYQSASQLEYLDPATPSGAYVTQPGGLFTDLTAQRLQAEKAISIADEALAMRTAVEKMGVLVGFPAQLAISSGVIAEPSVNADGSVGKPILTAIWQQAYLHEDNTPPLVGREPSVRLVDILPVGQDLTLNYTASPTPGFSLSSISVPGYTITPVTKSPTQNDVWEFELVPDGSTAATDQVKLAFKAESLPTSGTQTITIRARDPASDGVNGLDNSNMLAMNRLQTTPLFASSKSGSTSIYPKITDAGFSRTSTMQAFFSQTVSYVGARGSAVDVQLTAQTNVQLQIQNKRQSLSGVDLDEEAANLVKFQQAYQASSKVIQIARETFDAILQAIG